MAESRKTVTIVFADVTGSTALGEQTDPEAMRRIMERYFEEMRAVLEKHGGTVEKFIGDAVMAVFGIPNVHEDDALRAVRAAAEMRDRLAVLNEEFERDRGVTIAVRTGVNTGEVVAGDPAEGQAFATGDAVNVAARLEQAAEPGEILLGALTYRLVREAVRAEALAPLELKGKTHATDAWRLVRVLPDVPAFTRRLDAPFVGRADELTVLREAFERARATNLAELVTVVGPAGIGKSRLVRELVGSVANEARVLVGRCLSYGDGITYWPLGEIVREVAGEDIEAGLGAVFAGEEDGNAAVTHLVAAVGLGEAPSRSEEIAWAARRLFEVVARDRPLVVIADDIHWGESTLLDLLEYVVGFADAPILFACLARPDLFDSRPSWALPRPRATTLLLEPLGDEGSWTLVGALLSGADLSESVQEEIVARAEGNPLFVEQMLAHVRDGGNGETKVPPTIQALLTARIDSLEPIERAVMECGAVEGRLFHNGAVASLLEDDQPQGIAGHLVTLVRKELIRPDRAEFLGEDGFRFAHVLVRDAAYASLPKERRADLHARFATWLEGRVSGRLAEFAEIVGYHLERAYSYRLELGEADEEITDLGNRAGAHFASAGRRALDRGDLPAAIKLLTRAAELRPEAAPERLELAPKLGYALFDSGRPNEARSLMADSVEEARRIGSRRLETFVSLFRSKVESMLDPATQAQDVLDEALAAIEEYEPLGDDLVLTAAWENVKDVEWNRGRLTAARAAAGHALAHAERLGDIKLQAEHRTYMVASDYFGLPRIEDCIAQCEDFIVWTRANGSLAHEGMGLQALGTLLIEQKRPVEGEELRERGWALFDELGMALTKAGVQGSGAVFRGEFDSDEERLVVRMRSAYETLLAAGEKSLFSTVAANLAQALYLSGDYEGAERLSRESETAGGLDDVTTQVGWRAVRAKVLARRGELSQAEELARDALERALDTEYVALIGEVYESLGEVLLVAGRPEEARAAIQEALETFERKGLLLSADAMRTRLAELQSSGSPSQ